jgi:tetratricopeptide (TPR) repeat protein
MYAEYDKALELVNDSSMIKRWAILKSVSDSYLKDHEFEKAIKYYNDYLGCKPDVNFDDQEGLANIYSKYGDADPTKKAEMIQKAVELFRAAGEKFPIQQVYATYMAANNVNKLDDNMKNSLAKPDYLKLIQLLGTKADRTKGEDTMLKTAYHYMMFNSYINKKVADAKDFADKILAIDPEYKPALEIKNLK